jgi:hypothetical protein
MELAVDHLVVERLRVELLLNEPGDHSNMVYRRILYPRGWKRNKIRPIRVSTFIDLGFKLGSVGLQAFARLHRFCWQ